MLSSTIFNILVLPYFASMYTMRDLYSSITFANQILEIKEPWCVLEVFSEEV